MNCLYIFVQYKLMLPCAYLYVEEESKIREQESDLTISYFLMAFVLDGQISVVKFLT